VFAGVRGGDALIMYMILLGSWTPLRGTFMTLIIRVLDSGNGDRQQSHFQSVLSHSKSLWRILMRHYERALGGPALTVHTGTMVNTSKFI
jgi:hypothetical protein